MTAITPYDFVSDAVTNVETGWEFVKPTMKIVTGGAKILCELDSSNSQVERVADVATGVLGLGTLMLFKDFGQTVWRLIAGKQKKNDESNESKKPKETLWIKDAIANSATLLTVIAVANEIHKIVVGTAHWMQNLILPLAGVLTTLVCVSKVKTLVEMRGFSYETSTGLDDERWKKFLGKHAVEYLGSLKEQQEALQTLGHETEIDHVAVARKVNRFLERKRTLLKMEAFGAGVGAVAVALALSPITAPIGAGVLGVTSQVTKLASLTFKHLVVEREIDPVRYEHRTRDGNQPLLVIA